MIVTRRSTLRPLGQLYPVVVVSVIITLIVVAGTHVLAFQTTAASRSYSSCFYHRQRQSPTRCWCRQQPQQPHAQAPDDSLCDDDDDDGKQVSMMTGRMKSSSSSQRTVGAALDNDMPPVQSTTCRPRSLLLQRHHHHRHRKGSRSNRRRRVMSLFGRSITLATATTTPPTAQAAAAVMLGIGRKERRQLDYCLVNLLRMTYWAEMLVQELTSTATATNTDDESDFENKRKQLCLEARLGAKALLTTKVGGGANSRVYTLSTLQLRECLDDLTYYAATTKTTTSSSSRRNRQVSDLCQELLESIAAIVEFDGLETTTDPSPRSSLTLSMYNPQKAVFVQRLLSERIIPISQNLFTSFDDDVRQRCQTYVATTFPNEIVVVSSVLLE